MYDIVVVGSINADQVVVADKMPKKGETLQGTSYQLIAGGKGANQAVAIARLGQPVMMIGCVGEDYLGEFLIQGLEKNQVAIHAVRRMQNTTSGIAQITVAEGDNAIIVVPGANDYVTPAFVAEYEQVLREAKLVVVQMEIPIETVRYVIDYCYEQGTKVLLNPAPAKKLEKELIDKVSYLTPNEHECSLVFGTTHTDKLLGNYPNKLLVTQGEKGVLFHNGEEVVLIPAYKREVVDTTGAGDTFNGGFAVGIVEGMTVADAVSFGNQAASLAITKLGAQAGMPMRHELQG